METKQTPTTTPTAPPAKYYKKELVSNRLSLPNGRKVAFEQIGDTDTGVLATTDTGLALELDKAAAAGIGGVIEINEQQFQDLKKNPPVTRSRIKSLDAQSLRQILKDNRSPAANPPAAIKQEPSAPMEVARGLATVSSRKKLEELKKQAAAPAATPPAAPPAG